MYFEANHATVLGRDHRARERNRQDACDVRRGQAASGARFTVGAVSDGCGSSDRSELGAALLASAAVEEAAYQLTSGASAEEALRRAFERAARALRIVSAAVGRREARLDFVERHLLATLLLVVCDGEEIALGARGDGLVVVDDDVRLLDRGGAPDYLGYEVTGADLRGNTFVEILRAADVERVAIATDGIDAALAPSVFGHRGRGLQRWLNVQATTRPLVDDATVVVLEREEQPLW